MYKGKKICCTGNYVLQRMYEKSNKTDKVNKGKDKNKDRDRKIIKKKTTAKKH